MTIERKRYEEARAEADRRLKLAEKHNQQNYWLAAEAACQDAADLYDLYIHTLSQEERKKLNSERAEALLLMLAGKTEWP